MIYKGSSAYDDEDFFEEYIQKRQRQNSPNNLLEQPIINELIGDVRDIDILDIGCGDGLFGKSLLDLKAKSYYGIDGSKNMIELAQTNLKNYPARLEHIGLEDFDFGNDNYDLVVSRLVFHYVKDLSSVFKKITRALRIGGTFLFSVEHPVLTSCHDAYDSKSKRGKWIVDNYFKSGIRTKEWMGKKVTKYHRTFEDYFQLLDTAGLSFEVLRESKPIRAIFASAQEFERRSRIPLFLILKSSKA